MRMRMRMRTNPLKSVAAGVRRQLAPHQSRRSSSKAVPAEGVQIVMLPQLSPSMTSGKVRWLKQVGEEVDQYDLLFEVETSTLLAKGMSVTPDEVMTLEVEAQDDGVLVSIFPTGGSDEEFAAGTPLGVICDNLDDVALVQTAKNITAEDLDCNNIYACPELLERAFLWQAYSKSKPVEDI